MAMCNPPKRAPQDQIGGDYFLTGRAFFFSYWRIGRLQRLRSKTNPIVPLRDLAPAFVMALCLLIPMKILMVIRRFRVGI